MLHILVPRLITKMIECQLCKLNFSLLQNEEDINILEIIAETMSDNVHKDMQSSNCHLIIIFTISDKNNCKVTESREQKLFYSLLYSQQCLSIAYAQYLLI